MTKNSIRLKAALLLVALAALPALFVAERLQTVNRAAIETSERNLQASVLAEVAASTLGAVREMENDAKAVAAALATAAARNELEPVKALVSTRRSFDAVRFEVPTANVDTVIRRERSTVVELPHSTAELRREADERGVAFRVDTLVVPVPTASAGGARGYVTVRVDLARLDAELRTLAETRFSDGKIGLLVADSERRRVAAYGVDATDITRLPIWNTLPAGTPWRARVAVVTEFESDGQPAVGGVQTVEELGWAVALWRPRAVAYRALDDLQRQSLIAVIVTVIAALGIGLLAGETITRPVLRLARRATLIGQRRWRELEKPAARRDEIGELDRSMTRMADELERGEKELAREAKLRGDLGRFMSQDLVDAIVRGDHPLTLGGERREITVLFADVVAFTPLAESREAEDVVKILNELFTLLSEIVFRHDGTVDKFIGDCIMAVWGAPVRQPDHARRALAAAEDMVRFLESANENWSKLYGVEIRLAIGVNSGEAIVGNIGSDKRMEYTVVGDVVNVAARLEAVAKPDQILCTERTKELAGAGFSFRSLGSQRLTGRKAETTVLELVLDGDDG